MTSSPWYTPIPFARTARYALVLSAVTGVAVTIARSIAPGHGSLAWTLAAFVLAAVGVSEVETRCRRELGAPPAGRRLRNGAIALAAIGCAVMSTSPIATLALGALALIIAADVLVLAIKSIAAAPGALARIGAIAFGACSGLAWGGGFALLLLGIVVPLMSRGALPEKLQLHTRFENKVVIETRDGFDVAAVHLPGDPGAPAFVLVPSVGARAASLTDLAWGLRSLGYSTLRIDPRAHGESSGAITTFGVHEWEDVHAAVESMRMLHPDVPLFLLGVEGGYEAIRRGDTTNASGVIALFPDGPPAAQIASWLRPLGPIAPTAGSALAGAWGVVSGGASNALANPAEAIPLLWVDTEGATPTESATVVRVQERRLDVPVLLPTIEAFVAEQIAPK